MFEDTRVIILAVRVFRLLMVIAAVFDLKAEQFNAINTFINSYINEEAYIRFPVGILRDGKVLLLLCALYGLRRSPMLWQKDLGKTLEQLGLKKCYEESCLYINEHILVFFFVDDFVILYHHNNK